MSIENLAKMLERADRTDWDEGMVAYERYHIVMQKIADRYAFSLGTVIAIFCSLSPNSDYKGNLRSTISVIDGIRRNINPEQVTVSTYNHCKRRAQAIAMGEMDFLADTTGPKIRAFYHNILDPSDGRWVTVDGHMSAIWQGKALTMREALIPRKMYDIIRADIIGLAFRHYVIPQQMQAILWFTRKRVLNVVYDPQLKLFGDATDVWQTLAHADDIQPYPTRSERNEQTQTAADPEPQSQTGLVLEGGAGARAKGSEPEPPARPRSGPAIRGGGKRQA